MARTRPSRRSRATATCNTRGATPTRGASVVIVSPGCWQSTVQNRSPSATNSSGARRVRRHDLHVAHGDHAGNDTPERLPITNPEASPYDPGYDPSFAMSDLRWRWRYSWMFGIMYGPIPVGLLVAIPIYLAIR
jgi:hypothetical protein